MKIKKLHPNKEMTEISLPNIKSQA